MKDEFVVLKPEEEIPIRGGPLGRQGWQKAVAEGQRVFVPLNGRPASYRNTARAVVSQIGKAAAGKGHLALGERQGVRGFYVWIEKP